MSRKIKSNKSTDPTLEVLQSGGQIAVNLAARIMDEFSDPRDQSVTARLHRMVVEAKKVLRREREG